MVKDSLDHDISKVNFDETHRSLTESGYAGVNTHRNRESFSLPKESLNDITTVTNSPAEKSFDDFKSHLIEAFKKELLHEIFKTRRCSSFQ